MAEITAALVKDLREKSGAGMMDCKKALQENGGDVEASMDWLRTKGLAKAAKKADRAAAEGLVAGKVSADGKSGVVVEALGVIDYWFSAGRLRVHKTVHHHLLLAEGGELSDGDDEVAAVAWVPLGEVAGRLAHDDERLLMAKVPDLLAGAR